jgi:hypothetical protein
MVPLALPWLDHGVHSRMSFSRFPTRLLGRRISAGLTLAECLRVEDRLARPCRVTAGVRLESKCRTRREPASRGGRKSRM